MFKDYKRYNPSFIRAFRAYPGARFMFFFRGCAKFSKWNPLGWFFRFMFKRAKYKYGFQIPFNTKIGAGLFLGHFGNVVINQQAEIGNNCNIAQGVTIGQTNRGKKKGCPVIGDRVWIGANAVVAGNITIGNDVLIAPLSFINVDIPDNAVVAGNPAKVFNFNGSKDYINRVID